MSRIKALRRVLQVDARTDGEAGGDQDPVGQRHRGLRGRERRARQHTRRV